MSRMLDSFTEREDLQRLHASHIELLVRGWRADLMRLEAAEKEIGRLQAMLVEEHRRQGIEWPPPEGPETAA